MNKICLAMLSVLIAGCASTSTGVTSIGPNTYMLGERGGSFDYTASEIKVRLYRESQAFCASRGMLAVPLNSTGQDAGWQFASAEIQFRCTSKETG